MKPSALLTEALTYLWDGKSKRGLLHEYVCFAIDTASEKKGYRAHRAADKVTDDIQRSLGICPNVRYWLRWKIGIPNKELTNRRV